MAICLSLSVTPTSYVKVSSYGYDDGSKMVPLSSGVETEHRTIGKYIIEQKTITHETEMSPCYFFYLAKKSKKIDPQYGTGGAVVVKVIDSSVTNDKIRTLVVSNRIVLSVGGTANGFRTHPSKAKEFTNFYVDAEDTNYKWIVLKIKEKGEVKFSNYAIQLFGVLEQDDYNSGINDLLKFRNISNQSIISDYIQTSLTVSAVTHQSVTISSDSSKESKNKSEEGCSIF